MATKQAVATIDSLLRQIAAAQVKMAAANTEAGGYTGETSHPVKSVDDGTEKAREGSRSAENTADVKEQEKAPAVDSATPGGKGGQDSVQLNIGVQSSATGEDPSIETGSVKSTKEDSPTSHPARTDNSAIDGKKYAAHVLDLTKKAADKGNALVAAIANEAYGETQKRAAALAAQTRPEKAQSEEKAAADAGKAIADAVITPALQQDKRAEAVIVHAAIKETVDEAFNTAVKTASYLGDFFRSLEEQQTKAAELPSEKRPGDKENPDEQPADDQGPPSERGGGNDDLLAALSGETGGAPVAGSEGGPQSSLETGPAGLGGPDGLGGPGGPGGPDGLGGPNGPGGPVGPGGEPDPAMLMAILQQLGITPEMLQAAVLGKQAEVLIKSAKTRKPDQKLAWQPKTAAELKQFRHTLDYVRELVGV